MAQIVYSKKAFADLERLASFLLETAPRAAEETFELITEAVSVLGRHPHMGRLIDGGLRELVISRGHTGYIALYRVKPIEDTVLLLSIRHQREAGVNPEGLV